MRHLVTIQEILNVEPIENADKIELVHVLGWQCVATKGQFKTGDKCVYFEIDSFLPVKPEFEFLRDSSYRNNEFMGEGFKIKTMRMRGQISQGLVIPVPDELKDKEIGYDATEFFGVRKWELPEVASGDGTFLGERPDFIKRTDEMRIQAFPDLLNEFVGLDYYITTKCDGSSHSIGINADDRFFCSNRSANLSLEQGKNPFVDYIWNNQLMYKLAQYKADHNLQSIVIQGEWCGAGIQKNRLKLQKPQWYVFTVDEDYKRVDFNELKNVVKELGLEMVMIDEEGTDLPSKYTTIDALLAKADGKYPNGTTREGIVIRPKVPVYSKILGEDLSMKVINNKYLLKNDD